MMIKTKFAQIKRTWESGYFLKNAETDWLLAELDRLYLGPADHEYICKKCGLHQHSNTDEPTF